MTPNPQLSTLVSSLFLLFATAHSSTTPVRAQVQDGHYITAHFGSSSWGAGGLFVHHPRGAGYTAIPSLPAPVTGQGLGQAGANAVSIMPDGSLVVGIISANGAPLDLYHLDLRLGLPIIRRVITLGYGANNAQAQIAEISVIGPDKVLVAVSTVGLGPLGGPGPLAGHQLGIVTLSTGAVQPCPLQPMPVGSANAVAWDGQSAYVAMSNLATTTTDIWQVTCGGSQRLLVTLPNTTINSMEIDGSGRLLAAPPAYTINTTSGAVIGQCPFNTNSFAIEPVTGMLAGVHGSTARQDIWWAPPCGVKTVISTPPVAGWGIPGGIDVAHDPITYGAPSPANGPNYRFQLAPNAGGLPLLGNASFSLSVANNAGSATAGAWVIALRAQTPPWQLICIDVHLDPSQYLLSLPLAASPSAPAVLPLPIPNLPGLGDGRLFVQTVHPYNECLAASDGTRVTILR